MWLVLKSPENKSQLKSCDDGKSEALILPTLHSCCTAKESFFFFFFSERAYHPPLTTEEAQVPSLDEAVSFLMAKVQSDKFHGQWWNLHYFVCSQLMCVLFSWQGCSWSLKGERQLLVCLRLATAFWISWYPQGERGTISFMTASEHGELQKKKASWVQGGENGDGETKST